MSDSVQHHRWQPTKLPCPWDSPGQNTGVGCHFLLQCMKVKSESEVTHSCPTPSYPMDCSLPGSSVHGIFQARVLEWGAIAFSETLGIELKVHSPAQDGACSVCSFTVTVLPRAAGPWCSLVQTHPGFFSASRCQAWTTGFALLINSNLNHCDFHRVPGIIGVGVREWEDVTKKSALVLITLKVI